MAHIYGQACLRLKPMEGFRGVANAALAQIQVRVVERRREVRALDQSPIYTIALEQEGIPAHSHPPHLPEDLAHLAAGQHAPKRNLPVASCKESVVPPLRPVVAVAMDVSETRAHDLQARSVRVPLHIEHPIDGDLEGGLWPVHPGVHSPVLDGP